MSNLQKEEIPYLSLDPEIEKSIIADRAAGRLHPFRFRDENVVRRSSKEHDQATLTRPAFMRDVEKIVNLPAYNRYSGKTQVFSLVENDDISRRMLHVQLVNRVAQGIGTLLGLNTNLIEAIALGHDIGHTPFGHAGERYLSESYHKRTGRYFHHNVHSVRVLDQLYPRNLSLQTLDGVITHNGEFACQTLECGNVETFEQLDEMVEACNKDEQVIGTLRPSTLEGCVVRVSDMIAYLGKDRQDAIEMGVINSLDMFDSSVIGRDNARIINNVTADIVNNSYGSNKIAMSREVFDDLKLAKRQNYQVIYSQEGILDKPDNVVETMFEEMYARLLDDLVNERHESPIFRQHVKSLVKMSHSLTADAYLSQEPNRIVADYIASMTDNYFMNMYARLFPNSKRRIQKDYYDAD
ncbi:deoxyguanosinetriphosphate triphosphohydrolase family protein [Adlercreutzia sp. ZJ154]|uniref:deoxyguanosinetriphosphate triphosphohydrolase family protein n=1 Tax=Adlercreutzia sp. ZJ154 TaxID=2709790 RepID=UPI0013EBCE3E|nr:HD domain-containing protein [Adlercreutzia sp. ZJ154]